MGRKLGRRLQEEGLRVVLHDDEFAPGTLDVEWLTVVGQNGWIAITKDQRLRFRPLEKAALIAAGLRTFVFTSGNMSGAEVADAIVKALPKMRALLEIHKDAFVARVTSTSDVEIVDLQG